MNVTTSCIEAKTRLVSSSSHFRTALGIVQGLDFRDDQDYTFCMAFDTMVVVTNPPPPKFSCMYARNQRTRELQIMAIALGNVT